MDTLTLVYASRFGSTSLLAQDMVEAWRAGGVAADLLDAATRQPPPATGAIVVLSAIIWDRPLPAMREWLASHAPAAGARIVAAGVVCGSAGVRPQGGMSYARRLVARTGNAAAQPFALSGALPPRARLRAWEWWALKAFATTMRKPRLFTIVADRPGARRIAGELQKTTPPR